MKRQLLAVILAATSAAGFASAVTAANLTIEVTGVRSTTGHVLASLCGDTAATFPGACLSHIGRAVATAGTTRVMIEGVPEGTYAVQSFHDENDNNRPEIPAEGYAFGNDVPYPPTFDTAAVRVAGDTTTRLRLTYLGGANAAGGSARAEQGAAPPAGVKRVDLRADGLYGALYVPEGVQHAPALLLIGGSEGGLDTISQIATSFAKEGFVALALAYWRAPGLPGTLENIPLEYFDRGIAWLRARPEVAGARIGMLGWSRGAEAALLVGTRNRAIAAVVAVAPSSVVWQGLSYQERANDAAWTVKGSALPALVPVGQYRVDAPLAALFTAAFPEMDSHPEAAIPVERAHAGILLITGGDDQVWPATRFADRIMARLQVSRFGESYKHLDYPAAGHAVFAGAPNGSFARAFAQPNPMLGGTAAANAAAWADSWPRTIAFIRSELQDGGR